MPAPWCAPDGHRGSAQQRQAPVGQNGNGRVPLRRVDSRRFQRRPCPHLRHGNDPSMTRMPCSPWYRWPATPSGQRPRDSPAWTRSRPDNLLGGRAGESAPAPRPGRHPTVTRGRSRRASFPLPRACPARQGRKAPTAALDTPFGVWGGSRLGNRGAAGYVVFGGLLVTVTAVRPRSR